jgi:histone H3/H4
MNNTPDRSQFDFQEVIDRVSKEMQDAAKIPFSEHAFEALNEQIGTYAVELIRESVKKAKRHRAESVSFSDVEHAAEDLVVRPSHRIYRHVGALGGVILGTALSSLVSMTTTNQHGLTLIVITFILTFIGTSLMTIHMVKD